VADPLTVSDVSGLVLAAVAVSAVLGSVFAWVLSDQRRSLKEWKEQTERRHERVEERLSIVEGKQDSFADFAGYARRAIESGGGGKRKINFEEE
jgi:hypothetical protein